MLPPEGDAEPAQPVTLALETTTTTSENHQVTERPGSPPGMYWGDISHCWKVTLTSVGRTGLKQPGRFVEATPSWHRG